MSTIYAHVKGRSGALAALTLACALTIVLAGIAVTSLLHAAEGDTKTRLDQLAAFRAEVALRPSLDTNLKQALAHAASAPGLVRASSTALAQAQLESDIKSIAAANGADVRSTNILPSEKIKDFEIVSIQYDMSVPMSRLRDLTYMIETQTPYLFVDHVAIVAAQNWQPGDTGAHDPELDLRWTIRGYRWMGNR
jgi:type II secretion system (T2SS) protein M